MTDEADDGGKCSLPKSEQDKWRSQFKLPVVLSALSLAISLSSALFSYYQLALARESQLTPFKANMYVAKIGSYKAIYSRAKSIVEVAEVNSALGFNLSGFLAGWSDVSELTPDRRAANVHKLEVMNQQVKSAMPTFDRETPVILENSVVWTGRVHDLVKQFQTIVERDRRCYHVIDSIINIDPTEEHGQPFDKLSWELTEEPCKSIGEDGTKLAAIATQMDEAMRADLQTDQLQVLPPRSKGPA